MCFLGRDSRAAREVRLRRPAIFRDMVVFGL